MSSRLPKHSPEMSPIIGTTPLLRRLPLAAWLATLGLGGALLASAPVCAQSTTVPTRMAPLLVDPALLGGAPSVPAPSAAALAGGMPSAATGSKKAAAKKMAQQPVIQAPAQPVVAEPASTPVAAPSKSAAAAPATGTPVASARPPLWLQIGSDAVNHY